ncbi:MptD family putative ECF transporter S component [Streptococcus catagoni]|uniref:MptD family putative ECF transporter S component n=1 Tax=Streptococcus catagoni TaxID=2654874 RepID=UPI00140C0990|nr:MptD family putative ECF transporter S component [Streptococcus catagoni]
MTKQLKLKDFLLIALLTAVYMLIYFIIVPLSAPLGAFGHAISPGLCAFLAGPVLYFLSKKVGKMWQLTLMTALIMAVFTLMGGGYLPWLLSSLIMAVLADLLVSGSGKFSLFKLALASGLMHLGQALGAIIPSLFFVSQYREDWIKRGQSAADMDQYIKYTSGLWGFASSAIVFILAFAGVYLGYLILKKHLQEGNDGHF